MFATPFGRARMMMAAIAAAMRIPSVVARQMSLSGIGPYRSRGKGRGAPLRRYGNGGNNGGRGLPHQGPHECAKRARNVARGLQSPGTIKLMHQRKEAP